MKLGLVRRGYSHTGGAEAYLWRFAEAAVKAGHTCMLFSEQWPAGGWPYEHLTLKSKSPREFAARLAAARPREHCDFLFSLERVWECDAYRAGDGVHAAWLKRRARFEPAWKPFFRRFNAKHRQMLALEKHLFSAAGARLIIANSQMVAREIQQHFGVAPGRISIIHNGIPPLSIPADARVRTRRELSLGEDDYALFFAGSGWERKGLRFAIQAVNAAASSGGVEPRLFVAGHGARRGLPASDRVRFMGSVLEIPRYLAAMDAFLLPTLYDPFSNACLEALAAGLPVITTSHNGFSEMIEPGVEGEVIAQPDEVPALTRAIEKWAERGRREAIRPRLVELGARASIAENVRQTLALIEAARAS